MQSISKILIGLLKYKTSNDFIKVSYIDDTLHNLKINHKKQKYAKIYPEIHNDIKIINL